MKTKFLKTFLLMGVVSIFTACSNDDHDSDEIRTTLTELPQPTQVFLDTHFADAGFLSATKKKHPEADGTVYEVKLNNRFEIDFNSAGEWVDIDGNGQQIPDEIVPANILAFVQRHYPAPLYIEEIDQENRGYEVGLSNDVDLYFDLDGNFLGVDNDGDGSKDETAVSAQDLPVKARELLDMHFQGVQIRFVSKKNQPDPEDGTLFEVDLANGFEIDFDADGNWIEIDGDKKQVPNALVPQAILDYAQANYATAFIQEIKKTGYGYKVDLSNDTDLKFNAQGAFIGIDR